MSIYRLERKRLLHATRPPGGVFALCRLLRPCDMDIMKVKMKPGFNALIAVLLFVSLQTQAFAQSSTAKPVFPRIEPAQKALEFFSSGADNRDYSWTELSRISLWASGEDTASQESAVPGNAAASGLEQIRRISGEIHASAGFPAAPREKAEFILEYMHKNLLKAYSVNQTRIDTLLAGGRYNCVSSAVLYVILCKSAGLDAAGVVTKDHAFAVVHLPEGDVDVETTNPYGFDPGSRREFHDQFGKVTGFAYVPARDYRSRREISPVELVSLILWNRIADLEGGNRFAEAVPLAVDRAALLLGPSFAVVKETYSSLFVDPYQSLLDRLFNYAAYLLKYGKEDDCLLWAAFASSRYPEQKRWSEITYAAVNNRMNKYLRSGQIADARNFLESQKAVLVSSSYAQFDGMIVETELAGRVNGIRSAADGDSAAAAIDEARKVDKISGKKASELLTFAIQKTASVISAAPPASSGSRDWLGAINYLKAALDRYGPNSAVEQTLRSYQSNRAADFHNRFAAAWNKKNYDEAKRILDDGLAEFPNDRRLLADKDMINRR